MNQPKQKSNRDSNKNRNRSRRRGGKKRKPENKPPRKVEPPKTYALAIYENQNAAFDNLEALQERSKSFDKLNLVIRSEGAVDESKFESIDNIKIYAGTAWTSVHEKRQEEGWYDEAH